MVYYVNVNPFHLKQSYSARHFFYTAQDSNNLQLPSVNVWSEACSNTFVLINIQQNAVTYDNKSTHDTHDLKHNVHYANDDSRETISHSHKCVRPNRCMQNS